MRLQVRAALKAQQAAKEQDGRSVMQLQLAELDARKAQLVSEHEEKVARPNPRLPGFGAINSRALTALGPGKKIVCAGQADMTSSGTAPRVQAASKPESVSLLDVHCDAIAAQLEADNTRQRVRTPAGTQPGPNYALGRARGGQVGRARALPERSAR